MRALLIDIGLTILLATSIAIYLLQPKTPVPLTFKDVEQNSIPIENMAIILFWDQDVKASHRDIQLIQRFHQAHPNIQTIFVHSKDLSDDALQDFLVNLGVYTTPAYTEIWPEQIPTTILLAHSTRVDLNHSPHYSQLMEFFNVEH